MLAKMLANSEKCLETLGFKAFFVAEKEGFEPSRQFPDLHP